MKVECHIVAHSLGFSSHFWAVLSSYYLAWYRIARSEFHQQRVIHHLQAVTLDHIIQRSVELSPIKTMESWTVVRAVSYY